MTNPNNAVGTNAAYGGRTSVNAFNDDLNIYSRGIISGWACSPKSGMTVQIGGNGTERDVAVAEDNAGNKTSINNISGSPIDVTIPAAPATNNRIDLIVAYADNPPSGTSTVVDNPAACGIIVVSGTAASSPTPPTNAAIRSAITADGASGSTAYYVILAQIRVGTGVTTIGSGVITQGAKVESGAKAGANTVGTNSIADGAVTSAKISYSTESTSEQAVGTWTDGKTIYRKTYSGTYDSAANAVNNILTIPNVENIIDVKGYISDIDAKVAIGSLHMVGSTIAAAPIVMVAGTNLLVRCYTSTSGSNLTYAVTLFYTKS